MIEKRGYQRKEINAKAEVVIYSQVLNLLEEGTAIVRNISPEGGLISDLEIPSQSIPIAPFVVGLKILEGPLTGIYTTGSMTRFSRNGEVSMCLKFDKIGEKHLNRICNFVSNYKTIKQGGDICVRY